MPATHIPGEVCSRLRDTCKDPEIGVGLIIQEQQGDQEQLSKRSYRTGRSGRYLGGVRTLAKHKEPLNQ